MSSPKLRPPQAGQLPTASPVYNQGTQSALVSALRIYFNQIENTFGALLGGQGARFLEIPYATAARTTTQVAALADTPERVDTASATVLGITHTTGRLEVGFSGTYLLGVNLQLRNQDTAPHVLVWWLRRNGTDVPGSARYATVSDTAVMAAEFTLQLTAEDYVEVWWAVDDTQLELWAPAAMTVPYAAPTGTAATINLTFVSAPAA